MQGVVLDAASLGMHDINLQSLIGALDDCCVYEMTQVEHVAQRIAGKAVVMTNKVCLTRDILKQAPDLKLIVVLATGTNNIDLAAARECGITVCNIVNYGVETVAQHTVTLMLALATRLLDYTHDVKMGAWEQSPFFCLLHHSVVELNGKTLGIVGYGAIGQAVSRLAVALGMRVLVAQRPGGQNTSPDVERVPFAQLLAEVDVLSLHCPLTESTAQLINEQTLAQIKEGAFLINTARGGLVEAHALLAALRSGRLAGAALDVIDHEPPTTDHVLLNAFKNEKLNLILTPHSAWVSQQARQRLIDQAACVVRAFFAQQPINVVV